MEVSTVIIAEKKQQKHILSYYNCFPTTHTVYKVPEYPNRPKQKPIYPPHEVYKGKTDKLPLCVRNSFPRSHMNRRPTPQALIFTKQR